MPQKIDPNLIRICKICGETFHPTARKQYCCNRPREKTCVICGEPFTVLCNTDYLNKQTCSPACSAKLRKITLANNASTTVKHCKWCGETFHPRTPRDEYCDRIHYQTCVVCGKRFEVDVRHNAQVKTCSVECKNKLSLQNRDLVTEREHFVAAMNSKYGVDNAMKIPGVLDKIKETNLDKHGKEWYTQTEEYKNRVRATSQINYGADHFLSNPDVIEKRKSTCVDRYGTDNVSKLPEVQNKIQATLQDTYGVINISQTHIADLAAWQSFQADPRRYIKSNFNHLPTLVELSAYFGVCLTSIYNCVNLADNSDIIARCSSKMEAELIEFIHTISPSTYIEKHNRSIITPYELDIYIPELKIAFECNPTTTHNSSICDPWGGDPKSSNYHQLKSKMCECAGVRLIHIFGYEWTHKQAIIKSIISNLLQANSTKIHARKCNVVEISDPDCRMFLDANHRQGYSSSSIRLGLTYTDELVSVMTFSKPRMSISKSDNSSAEYELVRFCNKLNTSVVGGASKLFKCFLRKYSPSAVISYSDFARTCGKLYQTLGFEYQRLSEPGYVWVDTRTDIGYNRMNSQKQNICKFLKDNNIDLNQTENDIMISHGYVKVYDSGSKVWMWSR